MLYLDVVTKVVYRILSALCPISHCMNKFTDERKDADRSDLELAVWLPVTWLWQQASYTTVIIFQLTLRLHKYDPEAQ